MESNSVCGSGAGDNSSSGSGSGSGGSDFDLLEQVACSVLARVHFTACFYVDGIFVTLSIPLNVLILIVFSMAPHGTTRSTRVYYMVIASCELATSVTRDLLVLFVGHGLLYMSGGAINLRILNASLWHCRVLDFLMFTFQMTCNYTYVALAAERCLVLYFPFSARLVSRRSALAAVAAILAASSLVCSALLAGGSNLLRRHTQLDCYFDFASTAFGPLVAAMLLLTWFVSATLATCLNLLIVARLVAAAHARRRFAASRDLRSNTCRASVTLLLTSALHDAVLLPMAVCRTLPLFASLRNPPDLWLSVLFYPFLSVNHVCNFLVFSARVAPFRNSVRRIVTCAPLHTLKRPRPHPRIIASLSLSLHVHVLSGKPLAPNLTSDVIRLAKRTFDSRTC